MYAQRYSCIYKFRDHIFFVFCGLIAADDRHGFHGGNGIENVIAVVAFIRQNMREPEPVDQIKSLRVIIALSTRQYKT